jgi:hypothetical protein
MRAQHGEREPTEDDMAEAMIALAGRLPRIERLLYDLDHNDPDGTKARLLIAMAEA